VATPAVGPGTLIAGRYEILEILGKGGMGMVYKAHDRVLDDTVAIKLLRPDVASEPEMARRFRSEIKLARKVRHRNVCGIHEYGEDGGLRYIAMEYIEGVDLRHALTRTGAPLPAEAFEIAIQLAQGLHAIHEAGIIHRDLKTPNIMRDARGHVRLMDFGIAKQAGETPGAAVTALGMIVGTPEYLSPEQARGEKVDFRSDVYALGVVIFEIFTGQVPFPAETPIATIFKHLQDPPPIEEAALPAPLKKVLHKALAKSPAGRYATAAELVEALMGARAQAFPALHAAPPPPPEPRLGDLLAEADRLVSAQRLGEAQAVLRRAVDVDPHSTVAFRRLFEVASALAGQGEAKG
jgi:serine/threonine-protein kinase